MADFAERLKEALDMNNMSAAELCRRTNTPESVMSQYKSGKYVAKQKRLELYSRILNVSIQWLLGEDDSPGGFYGAHESAYERRNIPAVCGISNGEPIISDKNGAEYILSAADECPDLCLCAADDTMLKAGIKKDDMVFIRTDIKIENGNIAAVIADGAVSLKRVYSEPNAGRLIITSDDPSYTPRVYEGDALKNIKILGKAVSFQSKLNQ